jgi:hypothetical protein
MLVTAEFFLWRITQSVAEDELEPLFFFPTPPPPPPPFFSIRLGGVPSDGGSAMSRFWFWSGYGLLFMVCPEHSPSSSPSWSTDLYR